MARIDCRTRKEGHCLGERLGGLQVDRLALLNSYFWGSMFWKSPESEQQMVILREFNMLGSEEQLLM